jgi:RNA polymerase sigma-70 factor (ECF subfamily)
MNAHVADDIESLVATHRQGVHRYLCRIVGSADTAHDLTQEVFLRASRAGVPGANDIGQRAWVFRIARNLALNHLRDSRRRPELVALVERGTAATQELAMAVREALAALPDVDRDVFLLRESVGLSYDEIAEACGLTANAVGLRLHRARLALREALGGQVDDRRSGGVRWER